MSVFVALSVVIPVLAAVIGVLAWLSRRVGWWRQRRNLPGGLRLTFESAIGDPGFFLTLENFRALPIRVKAWGVMHAGDVPKGHKPKLVPLASVPVWAWCTQGVWAAGDELIAPLTSWHFRAGCDDPDDDEWHNDEQRKLLRALWDRRPPFVAWAQVDAVGFLFSGPSDGPWGRSDYPGFACARCHHDRASHRRTWRPRRNGIKGWYGPCEEAGVICGCGRYRAAKSHPDGVDPRQGSGRLS